MLGKTNITTLKEGGTVTEIEDFSWMSVSSNIRKDFKLAVFGNGILAGVTEGGDVAYTTDGDVWENTEIGYAECKINDIEWDGERFILVGSCLDAGQEAEREALVVTTLDFGTFDKLLESALSLYDECSFVYYQNGIHTFVAHESSYTGSAKRLRILHADLGQGNVTEGEKIEDYVVEHWLGAAKCSEGALISVRSSIRAAGSSSVRCGLYALRNDGVKNLGIDVGSYERSVIECKDELYVMELSVGKNYGLYKVTAANEKLNMCTGKNFGFVSGTYFDGCRLFINRHEMLILKKGENLADKTVDDMLEIAPEMSMSRIVKAFGRLYIFGNQGVILKSGTETNNEGALAVQSISAKKALAEAKKYADERYAELAARILALETKGGGV